jgi:hypothetical protein
MAFSWVAAAVFLIVETAVGLFTWMIRYHFRLFALPEDRRAKNVVRVFTVGILLLAAVSAAFLAGLFVA